MYVDIYIKYRNAQAQVIVSKQLTSTFCNYELQQICDICSLGSFCLNPNQSNVESESKVANDEVLFLFYGCDL